MSRAYTIYVITFVLLIAGLWIILAIGQSLRAPDDLTGEWAVEWENAPPPESGENVMRVSQSGRFFMVRFGERQAKSMTLAPGWAGRQHGRVLKMQLKDPEWTLDIRGDIPLKQRWQVPEVRIELVGPTRHVGVARRMTEEMPITAPGGTQASPAAAATPPAAPVDVDPDAAPAPVPATQPAPTAQTANAR